MATVLKNVKLLLDGYDLSGDGNAIALNRQKDLQDSTRFGQNTKSNAAGLRMEQAQFEGFLDMTAGKSEPVFDARYESTDTPVIIAPDGIASGDTALCGDILFANYNSSGGVGELFKYSVAMDVAENGYGIIRGNIAHNATETASGDGSGLNLGAVADGKSLYAALHVLSASVSDTLDVTIESDSDNTFVSPTTQINFTQMTDIGAQGLLVAAGPITDTWFRASFTIGGASPSFQFVVWIGIR